MIPLHPAIFTETQKSSTLDCTHRPPRISLPLYHPDKLSAIFLERDGHGVAPATEFPVALDGPACI
jgi:hypothetical protein